MLFFDVVIDLSLLFGRERYMLWLLRGAALWTLSPLVFSYLHSLSLASPVGWTNSNRFNIHFTGTGRVLASYWCGGIVCHFFFAMSLEEKKQNTAVLRMHVKLRSGFPERRIFPGKYLINLTCFLSRNVYI